MYSCTKTYLTLVGHKKIYSFSNPYFTLATYRRVFSCTKPYFTLDNSMLLCLTPFYTRCMIGSSIEPETSRFAVYFWATKNSPFSLISTKLADWKSVIREMSCGQVYSTEVYIFAQQGHWVKNEEVHWDQPLGCSSTVLDSDTLHLSFSETPTEQ